MKILYIITKSNWGGAQKYVFDLACVMKESGHDVSVAFGGDGILKRKLEENNINTIKIENLDRDINIFKEIKVFKDLFDLFKKEMPDIVHLNSSKIGGLGALAARFADVKKIIYTAHGFAFREDRPLWQIYIIKFISWITILLSHNTICVSKKDYEDVEHFAFAKEKLFMIHNGISIKDIPLKDEYNNNNIQIVSIGELHKNKGFEYAIKTINLLKNNIKNFKYTILSFGGDEKENLEKLITNLNLEEFVEIKINNENHSEKLNDFDIYFMPSIKEGLPYVLLEAGLYSLPFIASDTGGINEIVENYKNGFLIKSKDINGFELALERIILDKELRNNFASQARKKIEKEFDIKDMIENTLKVYNI